MTNPQLHGPLYLGDYRGTPIHGHASMARTPHAVTPTDSRSAPDEPVFSFDMLLGHVRLEKREVFDGGRMWFESRRLRYDRRNSLVEIGPWERFGGSIGWEDGTPYTAEDHVRVLGGLPRKACVREQRRAAAILVIGVCAVIAAIVAAKLVGWLP